MKRVFLAVAALIVSFSAGAVTQYLVSKARSEQKTCIRHPVAGVMSLSPYLVTLVTHLESGQQQLVPVTVEQILEIEKDVVSCPK